ncbi:hypothetical protein [Marinimicrobium sp. ABcell2]|uniref:hypothetical protein n=1 Tax=Marinimicrobium sp. ABcell2 TaxID=3069751 RepID=UPI0027B553DD|nr:hypothetical protein [Marinimicrobium sp. ABcell2]MDQ2077538.1 hypothetical protein [Marinimicrobium sp. ABcell2]
MAMDIQQQARELVDQMDTRHLKTLYEPPMCPRCGAACDRAAREGVWKHCDYSVSIPVWKLVCVQASQLREMLKAEKITTISFHGHPIPVEEAVQPTHLFPLFVAAAEEYGRIINQTPLLSLKPTDESADEAGTTLLPFYITLNDAGCQPTEYTLLLIGAAKEAIERMRKTDPTGSVMPAEIIIDIGHISVAA